MEFTSENDAFLATIKAANFDDAPRLVYADWLDEHDEATKAEYLRLVVRLRKDAHEAEALERLLAIAATLPEDWRSLVGSCFVTYLTIDNDSSADMLIRAIVQALTFFRKSNPPQDRIHSVPLLSNLTREQAEETLRQFALMRGSKLRLTVLAMVDPNATLPSTDQ